MLTQVVIELSKAVTPQKHTVVMTAVPDDEDGNFTVTYTAGEAAPTEIIETDHLVRLYSMLQPQEITVATTFEGKGKRSVMKQTYDFDRVMRHQYSINKAVKTFAKAEDSDYDTEEYAEDMDIVLWSAPKHHANFWYATTDVCMWVNELRTTSKTLALRPRLVGQECPITHEPLQLGKTYMLPCKHLVNKSAWAKVVHEPGNCSTKKCPLCRQVVKYCDPVLIE